MFSLFFTSQSEVCDLDDVSACDVERFNRFFHAMLARGVYLAPSAFEAGFVGAAHDDERISATLGGGRRSTRRSGITMTSYDIYALGNALVDMEYSVDDGFLRRHRIDKGHMTLVDEPRLEELLVSLRET